MHVVARNQEIDLQRPFDDSEFGRWVDLLRERTGVVVPAERRSFLATNLRMRMREAGFGDYGEYYQALQHPKQGAAEWATLVDRLTVHETRFFRHSPSLALVRAMVLPRLPRRNGKVDFHAWSVGCSTGEEAWSLAMVVDHALSMTGRTYYAGVTATDVSAPALATARQGSYRIERIEEVPQLYRENYVEQDGEHSFRIASQLRRRVAFATLNLLDMAGAPIRGLDLIYCQNVLIYFPRERRARLLDQMVDLLRPGGVLILGPGDVLTWSHDEMERIADPRTMAFRRSVSGDKS